MNIFIIILLIFAVIGFIDKAIGGKMELENEIDIGLSTMGTISIYNVGIYCLGITFVENNAEVITGFTNSFSMDPSIIIGCILATDLGAQPIALGVTGDKVMGYFSGIVVGGCLGQFVSFQLPVIFSMLDSVTKQKMIRGFIYGIVAIPFGLIAGGLVMGIPILKLLLNTSIIIVVCIALLIGFLRLPSATEKILLGISGIIKVVCQILFIMVIVGIFVPQINIVSKEVLLNALYLILRMTIIICGGLVLAKIITEILGNVLEKISRIMETDKLSTIGLLLNAISTLTVVPSLKNMDDNGKVLNGAFAVSGAYILGGQLAFVLLVAPNYAFAGFVTSKLTAGIMSIIIAVVVSKHKRERC